MPPPQPEHRDDTVDPPRQPEHRDDNLMERFDRTGTRRFRARDALAAAAIVVAILIVTSGTSIRKAGEQMNPGIGRDAVLAVGRPSAWLADHLPVRSAAHRLTAWLSPDPNLSGLSGFNQEVAVGAAAGIPPVTPDAFDPTTLGLPPPARRPLHTLLVTGDSMSEPLDQYLAQTLTPEGVHVFQDPHIGTGISSTILVDWAKLATYQVQHDHPDAIVVFIGANDAYSMPGPNGQNVNCCSAEWAAIYAGRVRRMMNTYRQAGTARVYWLTLPTARDPQRAAISRVVNAAIEVAAEPWRDQIRIVDTVPVFTPGNRYRDSMTINGVPTIVRQSDGIHLNNAGSALASKVVLAAVDRDFTR
jgi:lysophospholipase L1-like esterase